jgi:hypothetical protein
MNLLQLAEFAAAFDSGALTLFKLSDELKARNSLDPDGHALSIAAAAKALAVAINAALPIPLKPL